MNKMWKRFSTLCLVLLCVLLVTTYFKGQYVTAQNSRYAQRFQIQDVEYIYPNGNRKKIILKIDSETGDTWIYNETSDYTSTYRNWLGPIRTVASR